MTSNEVYLIIQYAVAKNTQQGYVSPDDFNNVLMPTAQRGYFDYLLGEYQKYQVRRPVPMVAFSQNERIRDSIAPLIYNITLPINSTTGIASYPSDYEYVDAMWTQYGLYNIKFVQQDRLSHYYRSTIDPIEDNPVYLLRHEGFWFKPEDIGAAYMSYVRNPPPIHWGYDYDGNGIPVWNPATSQDPIWSESDIMQIIVRALSLVGVNLQLNIVMGYAEQIKQGGQ